MSLADEKYLALSTYRKNGTTTACPIWIADLGDETIGFTTGDATLKVERLANDPRVIVQASDSRGGVKDGSAPATGSAVVVDGADFERVSAAIEAKYGWQVTLIDAYTKVVRVFGSKRQLSNRGIVITLDGS